MIQLKIKNSGNKHYESKKELPSGCDFQANYSFTNFTLQKKTKMNKHIKNKKKSIWGRTYDANDRGVELNVT